jgi:CBS domain-containing protein
VKAAEIMSSPAVTVDAHTSIIDAARLLIRKRIAALPVVDSDRHLVGIVSESDLFRARAVSCGFGLGGTVQLRAHQIPLRVVEIMQRQVLCVNAADSVQLCVSLMMRHQGRSLPVQRHGRVVGVVSRRDVLAAITRPDVDVRPAQPGTSPIGPVNLRERDDVGTPT